MAFPTTQLGIVTAIAPGADPIEPTAWEFVDISDDVRSASGVTITVGRQDEIGEVDSTGVAMTVDNRSGDYCRTNPLGVYFGQIGRGTPLEVRVTRIDDAFTRSSSPGLGTDTVSGLVWAHDAASAWAATGTAGTCTLAAANSATHAYLSAATGADVEVTGTVSLSAVTTGASWVHSIVVRSADTSNYYRMHVEFNTTGLIGCKLAKVIAGSITDLTANTNTGVGYSAGTVIAYRARIVGTTLLMRAWLASGSEPDTWNVTADDSTFTEAGRVGIYSWRVVGNTNVGSLVSTFDNYRTDVIRSITTIPEWPVRWDQSGNDSTAPLGGAGILRRLAQGQTALQSPIYRQLSGLGSYVQGYWPMEDGSDASRAANALTGKPAATVTGGTFGATTGPPGGSSALTLDTAVTSRVTGTVPSWTVAQDGYAGMAYIAMPAAVSGGTGIPLLEITATGTITRWVVEINDLSLTVNAYLSDGTLSFTNGPTLYGLDVTEPWAIELEAVEDGANVDWALVWHTVGSDGFAVASGTYAGTANRITSGTVWAPVDGTVVSHLWLGDDLLPFVDFTFMLVSNGYAGEAAGDRMVRLAAEGNVPLIVIGDTADTSPMGAQGSGTLLELLRECEDADLGVLHERGAGLGYLTRVGRYNATPVMELDFASGHVAAPPEPTDDDQRLRNHVTVTRTGGSTTPPARDEASIAVDGVYSEDLTINVQTDAQAIDQAYWRLHLGTLDGLRWPSITLDLARNPSLIDEWCRVRIGSRITIANPPDQVGVDDLDLIVEGWTETLSEFGWDVVVACSPASAWQVGVWDSATSLYDLRSCTMLSSAAAGVTTLTFWIADDESWSTTDEPYDLMISGERVTVTSMAARTGTFGAYEQVATVTRAVNGVSKTLPSTAEVHVATPGRWAI